MTSILAVKVTLVLTLRPEHLFVCLEGPSPMQLEK